MSAAGLVAPCDRIGSHPADKQFDEWDRMPFSSRPYFHSSLNELRELFLNNKNNVKVLTDVRAELDHRKRPPAVALRADVQRQIDVLARPSKEASPRKEPADDNAAGKAAGHESSKNDRKATGRSGNARAKSGAQQETYLRKPTKLKRIEPVGVAGRPSKYVRPAKTDIVLEIRAGLPRAARYAIALGALITDMRRQRHGSRQIPLEDGERISLDRGHVGYSFAFTEDVDLFEDARVELRIGARRVEGQIVSISGGRLIIAVEEDMGQAVARCVLIIDNTALLESLKERLEKIGEEGRTLNIKIADKVVSNTGEATPAAAPPSSLEFGNLKERQKEAVCLVLANEITYLWGPPGTGKTRTLSVLIDELFQRGKRILICSNTNRAVDQVLFRLCETLGRTHEAMEKGRIVRLGRITHEQLKKDYADYVTLDGIVERRSRDLKQRKAALESNLEKLARRSAKAEATLRLFAENDALEVVIVQTGQEFANLITGDKVRTKKLLAAKQTLQQLKNELEARNTAGALRRIFLRAETAISRDIVSTNAEIERLSLEVAQSSDLLRKAKDKGDRLAVHRNELAKALAAFDRGDLTKQMTAFKHERQPLLDELATLNRALADIEAAVMRDAAVIGATVTKTYLSASTLPAFDVVVVDEVSMVLLPALYYAVGCAREKVVISGDFRQLPPIIQTEQKAILDEIGNDVFHAAGIVSAGEVCLTAPRLVMLDEQHRMHGDICDLISGFMYRGKLRTAAAVTERAISICTPLTCPLTVVDTSSLWPFETQTSTFSRYNLVHALVVRNLVSQFREAGYSEDSETLGICTPYAAQAKLIRRIIEDEGLKGVETGTVHHYQGDEKYTIIVDIPESVGGGPFIGQFLQGDHPDDGGTKLLNVAVSRAKDHLVIVANLTYLDDRLPSGAFLRHILFEAQTRGEVLDATDILTLRPADLRGLGRPIDIDIEAQRTGLFGQKDFEAVFQADIDQAKKSVVIFSGFVTPERVATYGDLFREKILAGVKIRCVTRPPQFNGTISVARGKEALDALEGIGVVVDCRRAIHQKIAFIDGQIVWFGSLNPLSHTAQADETMMRALAPGFAAELARQVSIRTARREGDSENAPVLGENPRCPTCGNRTYYFRSRYGYGRAFFACESGCGWLQDVNSSAPGRNRTGDSENFPVDGPPCPKCRSKTRLRRGRHGLFYGCSQFPKCDGTVNTR